MFKCGIKSISNEPNIVFKVLKITMWVIIGLVGFCLLAFAIGFGVQALWNWLMPAIFNLPKITYWQAVGIMVLAKILTSGFTSGHSSSSDKKKDKTKEIHHHHYHDGETITEEK